MALKEFLLKKKKFKNTITIIDQRDGETERQSSGDREG
jgi:hypothetical protein